MIRLIEKLVEGWKRMVLSLTGVRVYDGPLLDPAMEQLLLVIAGALMVNFAVDAYLWSSAAQYGIGNTLIAIVAGFAVARVIYLFDKSWILADTTATPWWRQTIGFSFRMFVVFVAAYVTAVPLELEVLKPDINAELDRQEMAIRRERVDDLRKQAAGDSDTLVKTIREERTPKRESLLAKHQAQRDAIQKRIDGFAKEYLDETAGMGRSAQTNKGTGTGAIAKAAKKNQQEAEAELTAFEARATAELDEFDRKTEDDIKTALAESKARKAKVEEEAGGDKISPEVAAKYGLPTLSRGFMARWRALNYLSEHDERVEWLRLGLTIIMMIISFMPIGMKLINGRKLSRYFSEAAEAKAGSAGAIAALGSDGVNQAFLERLTWSSAGRDTLFALNKARRELCEALAMFYQQVEKYCVGMEELGRHYTLMELQHRIMHTWMASVYGKWKTARELADDLNNLGYAAPEWDPDLPFPEPKGATPWVMPEDKLRSLGWTEPHPDDFNVEEPPPGIDPDIWRAARQAEIRMRSAGLHPPTTTHDTEPIPLRPRAVPPPVAATEPPAVPPAEAGLPEAEVVPDETPLTAPTTPTPATEEDDAEAAGLTGGILGRFRKGFDSLVERGRAGLRARMRRRGES